MIFDDFSGKYHNIQQMKKNAQNLKNDVWYNKCNTT